ncbi:hypothetical protein OAL97_03920 [Paracoccaceae bacterium]|nr:hypothetical protein [Paracoccaceae bacterium]
MTTKNKVMMTGDLHDDFCWAIVQSNMRLDGVSFETALNANNPLEPIYERYIKEIADKNFKNIDEYKDWLSKVTWKQYYVVVRNHKGLFGRKVTTEFFKSLESVDFDFNFEDFVTEDYDDHDEFTDVSITFPNNFAYRFYWNDTGLDETIQFVSQETLNKMPTIFEKQYSEKKSLKTD